MILFSLIISAFSTPFLQINSKEPRDENINCKMFTRSISSEGIPDSTLKCTACENSYYKLDPTTGKCIYNTANCNTTDLYLYLDNSECKFCDYACNTCDSSGKCTCNFNTDFNTCKKCVQTISVTTGSTTVLKCKYCGQGLVTSTDLMSCETAESGDEVKDNTNCALSGLNNGKQSCLKCFGNYSYDSTTGHCSKDHHLMFGCIRQNGETCLKCDTGFYLSGSECSKNDENCETYKEGSDPLVCSRCREGYYLENGACKICTVNGDNTKQYDSLCDLFDTTKCNQCSRRCSVSGNSCVSTHCLEFASTGKCGICENGYYQNGGTCHYLSDNGFDLTSSTKKCLAGYYVDYDSATNTYTCKKCKGHFAECLTENTPTPGTSLFDGWTQTKDVPCEDENCLQCADDGKLCYKCTSLSGSQSVSLINGKCVITPSSITLEYIAQPPKDVGDYDTTYLFCKYKGVNTFFEDVVPAHTQELGYNIKCDVVYRRNYLYKTQTEGNTEIECATGNRDPKKNCQCKTGYYQANASSTVACVPVATSSNCLESANGQQCTVCPTGGKFTYEGKCVCPIGTYLKDNECQTCPELCSECTYTNSKIVCSACKPTEYSGQGRNPEKNCECMDNYVTESGKIDVCVALIDGCKEEGHYSVSNKQIYCKECDKEHFTIGNGLTQCSQCVDGYYLDTDGTCKKCNFGVGCATCNKTECTKCTDGNGILTPPSDNAAAYCTSCKTGYAYKSDDGSCVRCTSACDGCTYDLTLQETHCTACKNDRNPPYCICDNGVYLDPDTNKCKECNNNDYCGVECDYGSDIYVHCLKCKDPLRNPLTNCTSCIASNQYLDSTGSCVNCIDTCDICLNATYCTTCKASTFRTGFLCEKCLNGYYLDTDSNLCKACDPTCSSCTSENECTACVSANRKPVSGNKCDGCEDGYYWSATDKKCYECSNNCLICSDSSVCLQCTSNNNFNEVPVDGKCRCQDGYLFNETTETCSPCEEKINEFCSKCENGKCHLCNAEYFEAKDDKCVCKEGYYTTSWNSCVPCNRHINGCLTCESKEICTKCGEGYKLNETSGKCDGANLLVIVAIVMTIMALL
ncbi:furin repeat-containing protein, putative [Entamoeba invadens IP1]|uniref:Furin repeat-containing protein, putative n=1 Tax=Entamoeba invadens IP1 TaxID=370355 RepID=L7FQ45_ENTIV|nr:furin repeat-containing protein, putative [Entamoeba invadens IP1]ELP92504.1 furin repeat-containing protein, putative [Entamoeba invadens IP1]|eukprot:XP_004259275.1 furin repeat-containing protein, putative [Entamoeba invadens IP1]